MWKVKGQGCRMSSDCKALWGTFAIWWYWNTSNKLNWLDPPILTTFEKPLEEEEEEEEEVEEEEEEGGKEEEQEEKGGGKVEEQEEGGGGK